MKSGGAGLYVKDSFPSKNRLDLVTLSECIICELQVDKRKYFFVVAYRSRSQDLGEYNNFTTNFEPMISKLLAENPHCLIIIGDFNCKSTQWWENDIENSEGKLFELITADNGLHQLISEPTHIVGSSKSCIDLILTDPPNLIIDTGVHPLVHDQRHHQIIRGKLSVSNKSQPPYVRRVWHYDKADFVAIRKCIELFKWHEHLGKIVGPNEQVKLLNEVLLNIYSNFIPNQVKTVRPRQAPWIPNVVRNFLRKKSHAYRNFVKNGRPEDELEGIQQMISDGAKMIQKAKLNDLLRVGHTLANPGTSGKSYWSLINSIVNKAKAPNLPLLLENGPFDTDFSAKAQLFNDHFIHQCMVINTGSVVPQHDTSASFSLIHDAPIYEEQILNIIRSLNPNRAHGWDEISIRMIKLSDASLVTPPKTIFTNCLKKGIFPDVWKCANVFPVR